MSKTCLNCGRAISGEGKNKVFCNDCFSIMASFLRRLPKSDEPAMTVYERTKQNFPNMGISDKAAAYLEKCCKRYDEGMINSQPTQKTPTQTPSSADDGDYPDPIQLPRRRRPAPMRDMPHASDTNYVSGLRYDINDDTVNDKSGNDDAGATQMFSYNERTPSYEEYQYREYSEAAAKVAAEEAAREAAARAKTAKQPERPQERQQRRVADEYSAGVRVHNDNVPNSANNSNRANKAAHNDSDDYSYAVITEDPPTDDTKRRLYLILAAAAAAVILFAILAFSGLLTGSRKPNPPVGGSDSDSVSDDINNGAVVLPAESDSTEAPETTAAPDTTSSPVTTEPAVDPATCLHQWTAATCTEASVCTICGTVNGAPLGHSFSAPTCTEHGKCIRCGEVNTADTLAAHDYAPATCTDPQKCRMCGATKGEALGHEFSEPTCSEHGKCTRCGTVNKNDKLADHDYAAATCTEAQKCKVCGATKGDPLGHDYTAAPTFEWSDDLTCKYTLVCTRDKSHTTDGGAATVTHETTTPATCTTPGVETYTATAKVGGTTYMWSEKKTQEIPMVPHQFPDGSLECSVCGTSALQAGEFHGIGPSNSGVELGNTGLSVTVVDYSNGNLTYYVQNVDENYAVSEGHVRLIVRSGDEITYRDPIFSSEDDLGSEILSGETRPHTDVSFKTEEGDEPLFIEYYGDGNAPDGASNFWDEERHDDSLYWKA